MKAYLTVLDGHTDLVPYFVRYYTRLGATEFPILVYGTHGDADLVQYLVSQENAAG